MTPELADWVTKASKLYGSRSAYVRRLIERERDNAISERIGGLEMRLKIIEALQIREKQNP